MKILIIHCGGTLGMIHSNLGLHTQKGHIVSLMKRSSKLQNYNFDIIELDEIIDSSIATNKDWINIIHLIKDNYENYCGFLIIHGTDTLAYASSFITHMVKIPKPIVFTGAITPMEQNFEASETNIYDSLKIITSHISGVYIQFGGMLFNGDRVTKMSTNSEQAFIGTYCPVPHIQEIIFCDRVFEGQVAVLRLYPNVSDEIIFSMLRSSSALILQTYGTGNGLDNRILALESIKKYINAGGYVVNISQCFDSFVDCTYSASLGLANSGVICGKRCTLEAAYAILTFVIGNVEVNERKMKIIDLLNKYI